MIQKLVITPGETDSIGLEVTLKALEKLNKERRHQDKAFIFFATKTQLNEHQQVLKLNNLKINHCSSLEEKLEPGIHVITSESSSFSWFSQAVDYCFKNSSSSAVVTGPLRKASFATSNSLGHTDYLRQKFQGPCFMTFFGETYNSLLLSDHLPLNKISSLNFEQLLKDALEVLKTFPLDKKIALLGLNPHAGEGGLIGDIDEKVHKKFVQKHNELIEGPLPADSFFSIETYKKYAFLIANYHDQALIPFKLIHGFDGAQASLGLPFIRTSVDHGTGDDLYLKGLANHKSMLRAIDLAIDLLKLK